MIDIHCHILPGIDDGPKSMEESINLAKLAVNEGIKTIIATPHHKNGRYLNPKSKILEKVVELNNLLKKEGILLNVLPGQETAIHGELIEGYEKGDILPLDHSQYLFIELPPNHVPRYTDQLIYDIQLRGIIPIIVHPERNHEIIQHPDSLYDLVKKGSLAQITASSVVGAFGKKIKTFSEQLIEANLIHFIASDAHNTINRTFQLKKAYNHIENRYGFDMVYYFRENAELLVQGNSIYREIPYRIKKKKILGLF
jgi:protein-tyrosine phosphatase